jgi:rhamnosyltransferase
VFFKENQYLKKYKVDDAGLKMAFYIFKKSIIEFNLIALIQFFPNMLARYLGKRKGEK